MTKHTKPDTQTSSGRIAFNERGDAKWEWRTNTGTFKADIDTRQVKALQESTVAQLGVAPAAPVHRPDNNPYSTLDTLHTLSQKKPRRTLDDMRKLSEEIKKTRTQKKA
jgi:hypothetical protein